MAPKTQLRKCCVLFEIGRLADPVSLEDVKQSGALIQSLGGLGHLEGYRTTVNSRGRNTEEEPTDINVRRGQLLFPRAGPVRQ